jgi:hypothetical protein
MKVIPLGSRKKPDCPKCGSKVVVRIVYGYPSPELMERSNKGLVKLGGCCLFGNDPERYCKKCETEFSVDPK